MFARDGEFDFVIVGAGSAGSVLAARLSEDRAARVLLLEAGTAREPLFARIPAAFSRLFRTSADWDLRTEPEPELDGRRLFVPRGKLLGGSSAMNAMIYIRGNPADFDGWAAEGAPGWSYAEVLPYFVRSEDQGRGERAGHGVGGPLRIEDLRSPNPLSLAFVEACVEHGMPRNPDFNSGEQLGAGLYQVTQKRGQRVSAARGFLFPALGRPNLSVLAGAHATRVVLDGDRASGVEYVHGAQKHGVARATTLVILAAGAIGSPQLLLLSGIGPEPELRRLGIEPRAVLAGVGTNLQDHPVVPAYRRCTRPITLKNAEGPLAVLQYLLRRTGPLTSNIAEAGAFVASPHGGELPDIQYHFSPGLFLDHGFVRPPFHGYSLGATLIAPKSRGRLTLRSADPFDEPCLFGNHLSHPDDKRALRWGLELARELGGARAFDEFRGDEYWPNDERPAGGRLDAYLRRNTELLYHPCGTCRMGDDELAVVDAKLRVRGIAGLAVADASVMPTITRGNTHAPTVMIAERLAAFLRP